MKHQTWFHFNLMQSLTLSHSFYEIMSRALAQLHNKCSLSIQIWHLMKKAQTEGLSCLKWRISLGHQWSSNACDQYGQRTLSGQEEGQTAGRIPRGQVPNSKEGHHHYRFQTAMRPLTVAREHRVAKSVTGRLTNVWRLIYVMHIFYHFRPF